MTDLALGVLAVWCFAAAIVGLLMMLAKEGDE